MKILFLGDICAPPGREAVMALVPQLRREFNLDFVIANGENAAAGYGITTPIVGDLLKCGVNCVTTGDHFLDRKEIGQTLDRELRLLRPLNYPTGVPGHGSWLFEVAGQQVAVISLLGRVYLKPTDCPFQRVMPEVERIRTRTNIIIVDFHAEATAEKICMGWYLDGEVSAVIGTHTHVPTADERVLPRGTAYISDAGMCGGLDSVLGMKRDLAIRRMMLNIPLHLEPSRENIQVQGVLLEIDPATGRALSIERIARRYTPPEPPAPGSQSKPVNPTPHAKDDAPH